MKTMPVCSPRHEEEDGPSLCLRFGSFSLASLCLILWGMASESELGSSTGGLTCSVIIQKWQYLLLLWAISWRNTKQVCEIEYHIDFCLSEVVAVEIWVNECNNVGRDWKIFLGTAPFFLGIVRYKQGGEKKDHKNPRKAVMLVIANVTRKLIITFFFSYWYFTLPQ